MVVVADDVQGGGSLIVAWQVKGRKVLVVGGGHVAAGRIASCLAADALVTVVAPRKGLCEAVAERVRRRQVTYVEREFAEQDLFGVSLAMVAIDAPDASTVIYGLCKQRRIPVNVADVPSECDFYFGSQYRDGPLQIMVSTNGNGPKMAAIVRQQVQNALSPNLGRCIERVGELRKRLRLKAASRDQIKQRMSWMVQVCETWTIDELASMTIDDMDRLLEYFDRNECPTYDEIAPSNDEDWTKAWLCTIS